MKKRLTKIELFKQAMNFSAGHFTIFSESERENLHGHSFSVYVMFEAEVMENGTAFNYSIYKKIVLDICQFLDAVVLLPLKSPYLRIEESDEYVYALFNGDKEKIPFLKRDIKLLPVRNISVDELSHGFMQQLLVHIEENQEHFFHTTQ
ncbi:MAG: 6-carboxytetrahydropterin synthase [Microcoleaceae cyanobacterium]